MPALFRGVRMAGFRGLSKLIPRITSNASIDTTKLHLINQKLHKKLGPIYAESIGPDVDIVWIADAG